MSRLMAMEPGFRITELFAFTAVENDVEGVLSTSTPIGHMPLIGADMERIEALRPVAVHIAKKTGLTVHLRKFVALTTDQEPIEVIAP